MGEGWETARRRDDGNDWLVVRLGVPGMIHEVVIDTSRFVGNAPGWAALSDGETGAEILPRTRLLPDVEHLLRAVDAPAVRLARLDIFPDGGISRLRINGTVPAELHGQIGRRWSDLLPADQSAAVDPAAFFA